MQGNLHCTDMFFISFIEQEIKERFGEDKNFAAIGNENSLDYDFVDHEKASEIARFCGHLADKLGWKESSFQDNRGSVYWHFFREDIEAKDRALKKAKELYEKRILKEKIEYQRQEDVSRIYKQLQSKDRLKIEEERQKRKEEQILRRNEAAIQEQLRQKKIKECDRVVAGFVVNETVLYNKSFGKGVFIGFNDGRTLIYIKFDIEASKKAFQYPDSIDKYLFTDIQN